MAVKHANCVFESHELRGYWWLPETPNHSVVGVLNGSDAEGFRLSTSGSLIPAEESASPIDEFRRVFSGDSFDSHRIIHGDTVKGPVTLCDAFQIKQQSAWRGPKEFTYYANIVLVGVLLESTRQLHFSKVRVKFSVLCDWIDERVFQHNVDMSLRDATVAFSFPPARVIHDDECFSISLDFGISGPQHAVGQNQLLIEWEPQFVIESKNGEMSWKGDCVWDYSSIIGGLNQLLAVATFEPSYPFDVVGYTHSSNDDTPGESNAGTDTIELYREQRPQTSKFKHERVILPWKEISEEPRPYFQKWFAILHGLQGPLSLLIDSLGRRNSYSPDRFFNVVTALEGIHRFKNPEASKPTAEHESRIQAILASAPTSQREWLQQRLEYSYEPSLRKRLKDLTAEFNTSVAWLLGAEGTRKQQKAWRDRVIGGIVDSRNCLAHSLPEIGRNPGERYYQFTVFAELLIAMWLMREIGVRVEDIDNRIMNGFYTKQRRQRLVEFLREEF